ncbi:MAG: hypothetical protein ACAH80_05380 [Alphaproteobacteria bacterium]
MKRLFLMSTAVALALAFSPAEAQTGSETTNSNVGAMSNAPIGAMSDSTVGSPTNSTVGGMSDSTVGTMSNRSLGTAGDPTAGTINGRFSGTASSGPASTTMTTGSTSGNVSRRAPAESTFNFGLWDANHNGSLDEFEARAAFGSSTVLRIYDLNANGIMELEEAARIPR